MRDVSPSSVLLAVFNKEFKLDLVYIFHVVNACFSLLSLGFNSSIVNMIFLAFDIARLRSFTKHFSFLCLLSFHQCSYLYLSRGCHKRHISSFSTEEFAPICTTPRLANFLSDIKQKSLHIKSTRSRLYLPSAERDKKVQYLSTRYCTSCYTKRYRCIQCAGLLFLTVYLCCHQLLRLGSTELGARRTDRNK